MTAKLDKSQTDVSGFRYMVFDLPVHSGTYSERYQEIGTQLPYLKVFHYLLIERILGGKEWRFLELAPKVECTGANHLEQFYQDIIDGGGEGVILRDPGARLQPGRSPGYLKHKVQYKCAFYEVLNLPLEIQRFGSDNRGRGGQVSIRV